MLEPFPYCFNLISVFRPQTKAKPQQVRPNDNLLSRLSLKKHMSIQIRVFFSPETTHIF